MNKFAERAVVISLVAAMGISFSACGKKSGSGSSSADIPVVTIDETDSLLKQNLQISEVSADQSPEATEAAEGSANGEAVVTDADGNVIGGGGVSGDNSGSANGGAGGDSSGSANGGAGGDSSGSANGGSSNGGSSNGGSAAATEVVEVTDANGQVKLDENGSPETQIVEVTENANSGDNSGSSNSGDNSGSAAADVKTYQAWWLDMSQKKDFVFDGEFLVVTFKIKDTAASGNYGVSVAKADIANWDADTLKPDIYNGVVTIGDATAPSAPTFADGAFTLSTDYVKGNPGDTVDVAFRLQNNPGFVGFIFQFSFDANALEYQNIRVGSDAEGIIELES